MNDKIDTKRTLAMLGWLMVTGLGTLQLQPVLGGALIDRAGVGLSQMALLFGGELVAMAVGSGVAALCLNRFDRRIICLAGLALVAVSGVSSAFAGSYALLCLSRCVAGAGGGAVQAVIYGTTALRAKKDQTFAAINISLLLWGAITVTATPLVINRIGVAGVFLSFTLMAVLAIPGVKLIPPHAQASVRSNSVSAPRLGVKDVGILALFALLFGGHGVLWVYQERIGHAIGMSSAAIGAVLGLGVLAGAVGSAIAGALNRRLSHTSAQMIAFTGSILASLVIVYGQSSVAYAGAAWLLMAVWFFGLTYLLALTAERDPTGRLTALGNASVFVGQGLGPMAAAMVVGAGNFRSVGWLSSGVYLVCIGITLFVTADLKRRIGGFAAGK